MDTYHEKIYSISDMLINIQCVLPFGGVIVVFKMCVVNDNHKMWLLMTEMPHFLKFPEFQKWTGENGVMMAENGVITTKNW